MDRDALELRPPGHPDRSSCLSNLADHLSDRFGRTGDLSEIEEAIQLDREALKLRPPSHPSRPLSLNNLANHLVYRCDQTKSIDDIEEAIRLTREALEPRPSGHPHRVVSLKGLAILLSDWLDHPGRRKNLRVSTPETSGVEDALLSRLVAIFRTNIK